MKVTIISDIHDHVLNLQKVLAMPKVQATEAMLCCGDLCSPFIIKLLGQMYSKPIHIVLGNNDGDLAALIQNAKNYPNVHIHGEYFRGELGGRLFGMNHYPEKAIILAQNGGYDVVCYGHNHELLSERKIDDTLYLNPGTLMGFHGGHLKPITATFMIFDTKTLENEVHSV